jgi:phage baseplate assembly protein W
MARAEKFTPVTEQREYYSDFLMDLDQNPITGNLARVTNEESIKQALKNLILTTRMERPYKPLVGSRINSLLFEPAELGLVDSIMSEIRETININEPRVVLENVLAEWSPLDANALLVTIVFSTINNPEVTSMEVILQRVR